ncbi:hypothetical protein Tco_0871659 [Tanacetum coccineum]
MLNRNSYGEPIMMNLMRSDNRFADAFARYDSGGASGSGGSRARDREDGDDTGGEDGGDDTIVTFPQRHVAGENPAKGQNSREVSPATCRWRKGRNVAGESIECCSD